MTADVPPKGIILAGGSGSRLYPLTAVNNKHLLPVFDKPMIFYPLTTLMLAGIREIAVITTPEDATRFQTLLGDGRQWGLELTYLQQPAPEGLAQAFLIAEEFIAGGRVCLILGDNIFFGHGFPEHLQRAAARRTGATVFVQYVGNPQRFGVACLDAEGRVSGFVEKPTDPPSHYAVTGLYFYDARVVDIARSVRPSARGEYEITDVNNAYLELGEMNLVYLGRGTTWLDVGTPESLATATQFVQTIESLQNTRVACPEEVALRMGYIDREQLCRLAEGFRSSPYGQYIVRLLEGREPVETDGTL